MVVSREQFFTILDKVIPGGDKESIKDASRRIYFSQLSRDGLKEMFQYSKDARLYEYFEFPPQKTIEETGAYLEKLFQRIGTDIFDRKAMYWFIRRVEDNRMVGTFSLVNIDFGRKSAEWGYGVDPDLWGMGYPLEMMSVIKKYAFEVLGLNRLWGQTMITNQKTISSLLAAGCRQEGLLRDFYCKDGVFFDAWTYSLLAKDYKEQNAITHEAVAASPEQVAKILSKVISEDVTDFDKDMDHYYSWDSLTHFEVVVALQDSLGCTFSPDEIIKLRSVNQICQIVRAKK